MKNFKLTKRRVAGLAIVLAIASVGIFAGTYAKYVSTINLDDGATDQNAQVAVWHVGEPVSIGNLFSPYYYNASYSSDGSDLGNSGHGTYEADYDTVFNNSGGNPPENLIAPGTKGEKSFRIQDNLYDTGVAGGSTGPGGNTEVSYIVTFPELEPAESRVTFTGGTDDANNYLKTHLKFRLSIDGTQNITDWVTGDGLNEELAAVVLRYDSAGLDAVVKIEWEWSFDSETTPGEYDSSDGSAAAAQATVAVNFGTVRYEQVDNTVPKAGDDYIFAGTDWRVLKVEGNKALIIKSAALTGVESGTSDSTSAVSIPFLSETAVGALPAGYNSNQRGGHYFDSDGSNGYQDSGSATYTGSDDPKYKYGLKGAIDYYYEHTLKTYQDSILAVDLHDPDFDSFKAGFPLTDDDYKTYDEHDDYDNWSGFWYEGLSADTRFATTYSSAGTKQAFVLSYGDLSRTTSEKKWIDYGAGSVEVSYSKLLDFLGGDGSVMDIFWLRSGGDAWSAGTVINGAYSDSLILDIKWNVENFSTRIRPALWVTLS